MQFENEHHRETHERVERYLGELFEEDNTTFDPENGHFYVGYGSTVLEISVEAYGPEETILQVTAYCAQGVRLEEDLLLGLLELNHALPVGAFSLEEDLLLGLLELNHALPVGAFSLVGTDIFYSQSVLGKTLDRNDLLGTIAAVATITDDYDDKIVAKYGGQTALDRIRDTGGRHQRRTVGP